MKLFGNKHSKRKLPDNHAQDADMVSSGFDDTADLDITAVHAAYEAAAAEKNTDQIVKKHKKKRIKKAIIVVMVLLAVVLAAFAWYRSWATLPDISGGVHITPTPVLPTVTAEPVTSSSPAPEDTPDVNEAGQRDGVYTFLAVGVDQVSGSTDTIMVATFDIVNHTINVVSIPRDTLVDVSWNVKKVNTLYSASGLDGLLDGISDILGYKINCYAIIDLDAFVRIIDTIGGVYYDVPVDMNYYDPTQNLRINISKGYQWLDGEHAVGVVRFRSGYPTADIGRIGTQQDFLKAVAKQLLQIGNITKINEFAQIFSECVDTNLTVGNIVRFGEEFLKVKEEDINFYMLPAEYNGSIRGLSYCFINIDDWLDRINTDFNPLYEDITRDNVDIMQWSNGMAVSTTGKTYSIDSFYNNLG
ncbi:MAG: LCP family protein [Oscillospiraceae bacterium]